jgi:hypothetical protein
MSYIGNQPTTVAFLTDTFSGTGSQTAFTMQVAPASTSSILVAVTGVVQDPSTYAISGTTLTFSAAPPSGTSNISVRYLGIPASGVTTTAYRTVTEFTATAGQTSFSVPSYTVGYIDVYRNGVQLGSADFTATTGTTVVLTAAATAGDLVRTVSFYVSSVLNAIPSTASSVSTLYLQDASVTTAKIADANVTQAKLAANVVGNGPAFSVYASGSQALSNNTFTKIVFNAENFDTNNNFDSTTNYRFTPTVAGYYQLSGDVGLGGTSSVTQFVVQVYKNGSGVNPRLIDMSPSASLSSNSYINLSFSTLVYMNGSTDYVELYAYVYGASATLNGTSANGVAFQGSMVRSA